MYKFLFLTRSYRIRICVMKLLDKYQAGGLRISLKYLYFYYLSTFIIRVYHDDNDQYKQLSSLRLRSYYSQVIILFV